MLMKPRLHWILATLLCSEVLAIVIYWLAWFDDGAVTGVRVIPGHPKMLVDKLRRWARLEPP